MTCSCGSPMIRARRFEATRTVDVKWCQNVKCGRETEPLACCLWADLVRPETTKYGYRDVICAWCSARFACRHRDQRFCSTSCAARNREALREAM